MQVLTGTKREITLREWDEQLDKAMKKLDESKQCYQKFRDPSHLDWMREDAEKLIEIVKNVKEVITFMDEHGIK